ncbi:NBR1-Ig-like domain-containing protein [Thiothrix nivea]|uniref:Helix-turn-helix domain protein n=1 Tax=Thiothrix nivea (strain ATCC 35100 / DSM 5205 / JP2) TaxID=870187 RepID=A0A656HK30_THINJ|nr:NBR1-Ig-like domain-containing protein [Thiothrix nivea]EIJ35375.1 helix-turn-helix domain protein [Thiothrix nivea DSM 5205]
MSAFEVADYMRVRLKSLKMTTTEAARRSGISRQTWHKLLRADISEARLSTLVKVAETLEAHPLSMLRIYFNESLDKKTGRSSKQAKGDNKFAYGFVGDVTCPDNSVVQTALEFEKIWEVANLGSEPWIGWQLQCMDEPQQAALTPLSKSIPIPDTQPGEHARLGVHFRAPDVACHAISHWKCVNANGEVVFPRLSGLYCMVKVVDE